MIKPKVTEITYLGVIGRFSLFVNRAGLDRCQRHHTFYSYYFFMLFTELELKEPILRGLKQLGYEQTTPIQEQTIVAFANGKDIVGQSQTGTGKTAAFTLPLLNVLDPELKKIQAIILVPTRELAQQTQEEFFNLGRFARIRALAAYGGKSIRFQKKLIDEGMHVAVCTPGRAMDLIKRKFIDPDVIKYFVLDEVDRMLDMGFFDDIMQIVNRLPKERQTIMFSATMPAKIRQLAKTILRDPVEVKIAISRPPDSIMQTAYICEEGQKPAIIRNLFSEKSPEKVILFSGSKLKVKEITKTLRRMGLSVGEMHSDLDQAQRDSIMHEFRNNRVNMLIATDIVARGIDIDDITLVINYDVPWEVEDYVHRIGRTARAGENGMSITLVAPEEQYRFKQIEDFLEKSIFKIPLPEGIGEAPEYNPEANRRRKKQFSAPKGNFKRKHHGSGKRN